MNVACSGWKLATCRDLKSCKQPVFFGELVLLGFEMCGLGCRHLFAMFQGSCTVWAVCVQSVAAGQSHLYIMSLSRLKLLYSLVAELKPPEATVRDMLWERAGLYMRDMLWTY